MERRRKRRMDMPQRVGTFRDPLNGRLVSATLEQDGLIAMRYANSDAKPSLVTVDTFNEWFLKVLIPVPIKLDGPVQD